MALLFWATIGIVVGGSMIGVQYYSCLSASAGRAQCGHDNRYRGTFATSRDGVSFHETMPVRLRTRSDFANPAVAIMAEKRSLNKPVNSFASVLSTVPLRAADREQLILRWHFTASCRLVLLPLPSGDPFMKVRNSFVRRRLAVTAR